LTFLVTEFGRPFTPAGFGNWLRDQCDQANLHHCSAHGLRKATAAALAEAGATAHEIAAVTGHMSLEEIERYTRAARMTSPHLAESLRRYSAKASSGPGTGCTAKRSSFFFWNSGSLTMTFDAYKADAPNENETRLVVQASFPVRTIATDANRTRFPRSLHR
jgi:Phage integrase family